MHLFTVEKIAEFALQKIGAFPSSMASPNADDVSRAIQWMDLNVAEIVGTGKTFWLIPATVTKLLTAAVADYDLSTFLGTDWPDDGIIFVTDVYVRDSSGIDTKVEIISRRTYEDLADKDAVGTPTKIYIARTGSAPQFSIYPVPSDAVTSLRFVFQKYNPSFSGGSPEDGGNIAHGLPGEWQRWLVFATAADIGDGPVRRLPLPEIIQIRQLAGMSRLALEIYSNRENTTDLPVITSGLF